MALLKCKICGGSIILSADKTTGTCDSCGNESTIPRIDDEKRVALFNQGNELRMASQFDSAKTIYDRLIEENSEEAEAYWGRALSRYGIEYVRDPYTLAYVPTCHRSSYTSILDDADYLNAIKYAGITDKTKYEKEAEKIAEIQKAIMKIAVNEKPYDVFISYKETDKYGVRTVDSVEAEKLYNLLTKEGYRVFFSRVTLEDKAGEEYEPYIFAALYSAEVMLLLGTSLENIYAPWVRNEWSRYLIACSDDSEKRLIPCYKGMNPAELPKELSAIQGIDMSSVGYDLDLLRVIRKVIDTKKETVILNKVGGNADLLLKRGNMALEDHEWDKADSFFEEVLNLNPESSDAYLGKFLAVNHSYDIKSLTNHYINKYADVETEILQACDEATERINKSVNEYTLNGFFNTAEIRSLYNFDRGYKSELPARQKQKELVLQDFSDNKLLSRVKQYGSEELTLQIERMVEEVTAILDERIHNAQSDDEKKINIVKSQYEDHLIEADKKAKVIFNGNNEKYELTYIDLIEKFKSAKTVFSYEKVRKDLLAMNGYKDTADIAKACLEKKEQIKAEQNEAAAKRDKWMIKTGIAALLILFVLGIIISIYNAKIKPEIKYNNAISAKNSSDYDKAIDIFEELGDYKDSIDQIKDTKYSKANELLESGDYYAAIETYSELDDYEDSEDNLKEASYMQAEKCMDEADYANATLIYTNLKHYRDASEKKLLAKYEHANQYVESGDYENAYTIYSELSDYKDSQERKVEANVASIAAANVSDIVKFGNYNGLTEWIVIGKENNKALLLSRYAIERRAYNETREPITWEKSDLREWLNSDYYDSAFDSFEQNVIIKSYLSTSDNESQGVDGGRDTEDNVFLLSIDELEAYLPEKDSRKTALINEKLCVHWWLRSPGVNLGKNTAVVYDTGMLNKEGWPVDENDSASVRPAMWIDLSSINNN